MNEALVKYAVLGSGSAGNAYIIETNEFSVVVDQGYSLADFKQRLNQANFNIHNIAFIFLTHLHTDHSKGVLELAQYLSIPVIMHAKTPLKGKETIQRWDIFPTRHYTYGNLSFTAFATSHDSPYSQSYSIDMAGYRFTIITDTGTILPDMVKFAEQSNVLFLESNYSHSMLMEGAYPAFLKQRVAGNKGHLSNTRCATFLKQIDNPTLKRIFLCHISDNNNSLQHVKAEVNPIFPLTSKVVLCPRDQLMPTEYLGLNTNYYKVLTFLEAV